MRVNTDEKGLIKVLYNSYRERVGPPLFVFWRATTRFYIAPNRPYGSPLPEAVLNAKELRGEVQMSMRPGWNTSQEDGFAYAEIGTADWPTGSYHVNLLIHTGQDALPGEFDSATVTVDNEAMAASGATCEPETYDLRPIS